MKRYFVILSMVVFCAGITILSITSGYEAPVDSRNGAIDNGAAKIKSAPIVTSPGPSHKVRT